MPFLFLSKLGALFCHSQRILLGQNIANMDAAVEYCLLGGIGTVIFFCKDVILPVVMRFQFKERDS